MSSTFPCPTCGSTVPNDNDRARAVALCKGKHVTPSELDALIFVLNFRRTEGFSPTLQEIANEFAVTRVTVFEQVGNLVSKGILRKSPRLSRSLEPVENGTVARGQVQIYVGKRK